MRRLPGYYDGSRMEPHYIPVDSRDRVHYIEPHYIPINSEGQAQRAPRQTITSAAGLNGLTHVRNLPSREEVIVLSP